MLSKQILLTAKECLPQEYNLREEQIAATSFPSTSYIFKLTLAFDGI